MNIISDYKKLLAITGSLLLFPTDATPMFQWIKGLFGYQSEKSTQPAMVDHKQETDITIMHKQTSKMTLDEIDTPLIGTDELKSCLSQTLPMFSHEFINLILVYAAIAQCTQTIGCCKKEITCIVELPGKKIAITSVESTAKDVFISNHPQRLLFHDISVWDLEKGTCLYKLTGHTGSITNLLYLPATKQLASSACDNCDKLDNTIKIWDLEQQACVKTLRGHERGINILLVTDDNQLVSGSWDSTVKLWDVSSGKCCRTKRIPAGGGISFIAKVSGNRIVAGTWHGLIMLWKLDTNTCNLMNEPDDESEDELEIRHKDGITCMVEYQPNKLAVSSWDGMLTFWDLRQETCVKAQQFETSIIKITATENGKILASLASNLDRLYQLPNGILIVRNHDETTGCNVLELEENCNTICSLETPKDPLSISCVIQSATDPYTIIAGSWEGVVQIWRIGTN